MQLYIPELRLSVEVSPDANTTAVRRKYLENKARRDAAAVPFGNRNSGYKKRKQI